MHAKWHSKTGFSWIFQRKRAINFSFDKIESNVTLYIFSECNFWDAYARRLKLSSLMWFRCIVTFGCTVTQHQLSDCGGRALCQGRLADKIKIRMNRLVCAIEISACATGVKYNSHFLSPKADFIRVYIRSLEKKLARFKVKTHTSPSFSAVAGAVCVKTLTKRVFKLVWTLIAISFSPNVCPYGRQWWYHPI